MSKTRYHKEYNIDENGWCFAYEIGDLVKVNDKKLGIVLKKTIDVQETMFPFIRIYLLEDSNIYDYGLNSLEIVDIFIPLYKNLLLPRILLENVSFSGLEKNVLH